MTLQATDGAAPLRASGRLTDPSATFWGRAMLIAVAVVSAAAFSLGFLWWLSALTIVGFVAACVGFIRPGLGLVGISLLCTLDAIMRHFLLDAGVRYLRFNTLNYWLLIVIVCHQGLLRRLGDPQSRLLIAFVALLTFELAFSERINRGAQHVLGIASLFGLLVYFVRACTRDRAWFWQGVVSGSAGAAGGLLYNVQYADIPPLNHNVYALFPETAIFALLLAFGFAASRREEFVLLSLAAMNLVWVFLSGSRTALIIAAASLAFLIVSMRGAGKKLAYSTGAVLIAVLVSGWFADKQSATMVRLQKLWSAEETGDARTSGRSSLALGGWYIFLNHPLGVGTGESELAWSRLGYVQGVSDLKAGQEFSLHSGWVKVLAENGLPGVLMFAAVVLSFAFVGWHTGDSFLRSFGVAVTLILGVAFVSTEFQGKAFWFLAAGAMAVLNRRHVLTAFAGGRRRYVWWVRPGLPAHVLRPRPVEGPAAAAAEPARRKSGV